MTAWEGGPPTSCFVLETSQAQSWSVVRWRGVRGGLGWEFQGVPGPENKMPSLHVAKMQVFL
jgi:hypothetical protein